MELLKLKLDYTALNLYTDKPYGTVPSELQLRPAETPVRWYAAVSHAR